jgi:glycosyltransferase involved in cell wall biosynthesis
MPRVWAEQQGHLLLVGRGDDRERLGELTEDLELQHCVHFLGFVPEEDLPALYRVVDLFAIASTCEVQSLPTLQALVTGVPVVAADALALPELVHDGQNGYLVPPGDPDAMAEAMLRLLRDPALAAQMGREGLAIGLAHAEEQTFEAYEQLYQQLPSAR